MNCRGYDWDGAPWPCPNEVGAWVEVQPLCDACAQRQRECRQAELDAMLSKVSGRKR